jgi:hypothetical protein
VTENELDEIAIASRPPEAEKVESWRAYVLLQAGCPGELALELAARGDVDLHQAVDLFENGCPGPTAARILL